MELTQRLTLLSTKINPSLIIDVGVAYGTPLLYQAWPNAALALVEPNPAFHEYLHSQYVAHGLGVLYKVAASSCQSEVILNARMDGSSIVAKIEVAHGSPSNHLVVQTSTLDALIQDQLSEQYRAILKTDCQGHDNEVLLGASNTLKYCDLVIAEAHIYPWSGSERNHLSSIISIMNSHNFCLYDIVDPLYRPHDSALAQVDALFVPRSSSLVSYQGF